MSWSVDTAGLGLADTPNGNLSSGGSVPVTITWNASVTNGAMVTFTATATVTPVPSSATVTVTCS